MPHTLPLWSGRIDSAEGESARRWHQVVTPLTSGQKPGIALLGFACDEGVRRNQGRTGAAAGPAVLRKALANLAWHAALPVYEAGDIACADGDLASAQQKLGQAVHQHLAAGHLSLVLGGGHETAFGHWLGIADAFPAERIGIVNLDAHFDLRESLEATSGTPFAQIAAACALRGQDFNYLCMGVAETANTKALFNTAQRLGASWRADHAMTPWQLADTEAQLLAFVANSDLIYLTIDADVLPAAQMPAVSAPAGFGVDISIIEHLCRLLAASGKLVAADLAEFNPLFDIDSHGAKAAARLISTLATAFKAPTPLNREQP